MITTATIGPITTEGAPKGGGGDPMAEAVKFAAEHPKVVPPGIHVPSNQYGPKAIARKEAEEGGDAPSEPEI